MIEYRYRAVIKRVYDGDTVFVEIPVDVGFGIKVVICGSDGKGEPLRLFGIDAPELRGKDKKKGIESRDALRRMLPVGAEVEVETIKDKKGKYGRYLTIIHVDGENVNEWMVRNGFAVRKKY